MLVGEFERADEADNSDAPLHHALAEPHRRRLVAALREAGAPLDTERLTDIVGLHPNTVRWHLRVLEEAGLVERRPLASSEQPRPRGRPRLGFALVDQTSLVNEYHLLAAILAASLTGAGDGQALALEAGRAWGGSLVDEAGAGSNGGTAESLDRLLRMLGRHGFQPELTEDGLAMHACPYHDLALEHGSVVCAAHRGIVEAALTRLQVPLRVVDILPLPPPSICVMRLEPTPAPS
jgi:predicted ArsR family transcriptional regulator